MKDDMTNVTHTVIRSPAPMASAGTSVYPPVANVSLARVGTNSCEYK